MAYSRVDLFEYYLKFRKYDKNKLLPCTHLMMDGRHGGKFTVNDMQEFHGLYAKALDHGNESALRMCLIEVKTNIFKLFFDVDLPKEEISDAEVISLAAAIQKGVAFYFQDGEASNPYRCNSIVCAVGKFSEGQGTERSDGGIHCIFPNIVVDRDMALMIRSGVVSEVRGRKWTGILENVDWNKIIDISVLTTSGLRMIGSDKTQKCPKCYGGWGGDCGLCERSSGYVTLGRRYWPWKVLGRNGALDSDKLKTLVVNLAHAVGQCSVRVMDERTAAISADFHVPANAPLPSRVCPLTGVESSAIRQDAIDPLTGRYKIDDGNNTKKTSADVIHEVDAASEHYRLVLEEIRSVHPNYKSIEIKSLELLKGNNQATYRVKVKGFGSRFCFNKNDAHKSQEIYFTITEGGIRQKCFSRKDELRTHGLCRDFKSRLFDLSPQTKSVLFSSSSLPIGPMTTSWMHRGHVHVSDTVKAGENEPLPKRKRGGNTKILQRRPTLPDFFDR